MDLIECVIGLGPNLFYNSPMEACIIICKSKKLNKAKGKILMINAVNEVVRKNAESMLTNDHIQKILSAYTAFETIDGFSKVVSIDEIAEKRYNLNISLYAYSQRFSQNLVMDAATAYNAWKQSSAALTDVYDGLMDLLNR
jgi:type I restriction enzyme M protein